MAAGTYSVSTSQTVSNPSASITGSISGATLTVTGAVTGTVAVGETITGAGVAANTTITSFIAGTGTNGGDGMYRISTSQTVPTETMSLSGMSLSGSNALYASVVAELNGVTGNDASAPGK